MKEFLLALLATGAFGSVLEWVIHRHIMHDPRFKLAFRRHTLEHHSHRRAPGQYYAKCEAERAYHLFETSYMPVVFVANTPYYLLWFWLAGQGGALGAVVGTAGYIITYELLHWAMHSASRLPEVALFRFLCEHHRRHHRRARINYNVVCPLGDLLFGTFSFEKIPPEPEDTHD